MKKEGFLNETNQSCNEFIKKVTELPASTLKTQYIKKSEEKTA